MNEALIVVSAPRDAAGNTPAPLPRGARRRLRNREAMLDAAEELFASRPFMLVRVEDVAEAADVSVGSVYMHFQSKDGLMIAVAERCLDRAALGMAEAVASNKTPIEQINATGAAYLRLLVENPVLVRFLATDTLSGQLTTVEEHISARVELIRAGFELLVESAIAAGQIRPVNSRYAAHFLFGAWNGVAAMTLRSGATAISLEEMQATLEEAQKVILIGMASKPFTATVAEAADAVLAQRLAE